MERQSRDRDGGLGERRWRRVLSDIRGALEKLGASRFVMKDRKAREIYNSLALAEGMEEFHAGVEQLGKRVEELFGRKAGTPKTPRRLGAELPPSLQSVVGASENRRPSRHVVRL